MTPIPITLLTGFLGSGKTTFLNMLLREPRFSGTAVLINELGEVSLDHDLIAHVDGDLVSTTTGCLCCSATSDVQQALFDLWNRRRAREIPAFSRVIIETTGLVDPAPVVASLIAPPTANLIDRTMAIQFALSRVVTLLDALNGEATLERHFEMLKQVALADLIILSKTDLAEDPASSTDLDNLRAQVTDLNPTAVVVDRHKDWATIMDQLLASGTFDLRSKGEDAVAWLAAESVIAHEHATSTTTDPNRHADGIRSHVIVIDEPLPPTVFGFFLNALKMSVGPDLLRMKGLFCLADDPGRPVVAHGVQHQIYEVDRLPEWPSPDKRTRVVLIGRDLNIEAMRSVLNAAKPKKRTSKSRVKQLFARG
ncbi:MAG: GTP-binding protein [Pseudomonadota bacterium]